MITKTAEGIIDSIKKRWAYNQAVNAARKAHRDAYKAYEDELKRTTKTKNKLSKADRHSYNYASLDNEYRRQMEQTKRLKAEMTAAGITLNDLINAGVLPEPKAAPVIDSVDDVIHEAVQEAPQPNTMLDNLVQRAKSNPKAALALGGTALAGSAGIGYALGRRAD